VITLQLDTEVKRVVRYTDDSEIEEARAIAFGLMPPGAKQTHIPTTEMRCTARGNRRQYCPQCENYGMFSWAIAKK